MSRTVDNAKRLVFAATIMFVALAVILETVMIGYWFVALQPRLKADAISQAQVLARSQSNVIAHAILSPRQNRVANLVSTLDEVLLLRDPSSNVRFFQSVEIQVDYDSIDAPRGSLDLRRGDTTEGGFRIEVPLYNPESSEVIGVAWLRVSDRFHQQLALDMRRELLVLSGSVLAILVLVWGVIAILLRRLERQAEEKIRVEHDLSLQEARYQRLVNSLSTYFVYSKDAAGRLTFVSDSVRSVLRLAPEQFIARHAEQLSKASPDNATAAERVYNVELADDAGAPHHLEFSEVRVVDDQGTLTGYEGIARDITQQRAFQEELRHAKEQAEAASRAKSQFLANVSHEIRTPLNAISGIAQLALKTTLAPKTRDSIEKIRASARLLAEIIEDILDLSRVEAGRLEIQRIDFDLDDMLAELSDVVGVRAGQKNIEILFAAAPDVPRRLRGDPVRLKQVILNLLNNALKFTERGEIVVEITTVESRRELAELRFSVRDTGVGIPPEHIPTLFDAFTQVDGSMTRRFGGAGLGLAISRRLVRMMGGEINVESKEGEGSTFYFTATFDVPRGPSGPRRLADEFRDLPVLVADDNAHARVILGNMLRSLSCRVTVVDSGEEAIRQARLAEEEGHPFKLALLDWKMPGLDGAETATHLTDAISETPLPVILVTAYDREEAIRCAEKAGIDVVLHKPVSPSTLHDAVLRVLEPTHVSSQHLRSDVRFAAGQRLLLVEDNAINREVARELLTAAGLEVVEAHNGYEALEQLKKNEFAAVMMDVQMPELDGIETVRLIRKQQKFATLPVVAMTAHAMLGDRERFIEAGMSDYVAKPIEELELLRVLAKWLQVVSDEPNEPLQQESQTGLPSTLPGLEVEEGVRRVSGNVELYQRLVASFKNDNGDLVLRLRNLVDSGAKDKALDLLHTLKGSAGTVGARRLASAAAALEIGLRGSSDGSVHLDELQSALEEFRRSAERLPIKRVSAPVAVVTSGLPIASVEIEPLVRRLVAQLEQNDFAAAETFADLRRLLQGARSDQMQLIEEALDRLDFEAARVEVMAIGTSLQSRGNA